MMAYPRRFKRNRANHPCSANVSDGTGSPISSLFIRSPAMCAWVGLLSTIEASAEIRSNALMVKIENISMIFNTEHGVDNERRLSDLKIITLICT